MKRMLVIAIVTFVLNGCFAIIESHGPRGFGEPGWASRLQRAPLAIQSYSYWIPAHAEPARSPPWPLETPAKNSAQIFQRTPKRNWLSLGSSVNRVNPALLGSGSESSVSKSLPENLR